ncbi:MAG: hypothetical protein HQ507_00140 [Candidatus Marinimicrobia bacterium]|nr:hypothetical protein [Candidatus Neomarinimicrobiota bacterium]
MKNRLNQIALIILILSLGLYAGQPAQLAQYDDLPKGVYSDLVSSGFFDLYEVYFEMTPFFQRGDFNGDGKFDIAIQVISKTSRKRGIVFLHNNDLNYHVIGAGKKFADLGDDFSWLKKWRIDAHTLQTSNINESAEALILDNPDFPKSLVYFDGRSYRSKGMDAYSYFSDGPVFSQALPPQL